MTIVIARQFGEAIVILSDTEISDTHSVRGNAIPGRLKAIILNDGLSVAYAGHSDPALHAIRQVPTLFCERGLDAVLQHLGQVTNTQGLDIDFVVASHHPTAEIRRIWPGPLPALGLMIVSAELPKQESNFSCSASSRGGVSRL